MLIIFWISSISDAYYVRISSNKLTLQAITMTLSHVIHVPHFIHGIICKVHDFFVIKNRQGCQGKWDNPCAVVKRPAFPNFPNVTAHLCKTLVMAYRIILVVMFSLFISAKILAIIKDLKNDSKEYFFKREINSPSTDLLKIKEPGKYWSMIFVK